MRTTSETIKISVIIPYFQREREILNRALTSVLRQNLPTNVIVEVIVIDDGSPVPAQQEVGGLVFQSPFRLILIPQANSGVAAARNAGLAVLDETSRYIAFLDSDDSWHENHLWQGITALEQGHDFYFCDNRREGHHHSNFTLGKGLILPFVEQAGNADFISVPKDKLAAIILQDCPSQMSSIIYRRGIAPELRFDTSKKRAGEDITFFLMLLSNVQNPCFSPKVMVTCGQGINIYFGNLHWNSDGNLGRIIDNLRAHISIKSHCNLSTENSRWNDGEIMKLRREVAFHALRKYIKNRGKWPDELNVLRYEDRWFLCWFIICTVQVALGRIMKLYSPR